MSSFPNSPRLVKGGIVTVDPDGSAIRTIFALQYDPDFLFGARAIGRGLTS